MAELFPTMPTPDLYEENNQTTINYGKAWAYDFENNEFVIDGAGRFIELDGYEAWKQWCKKTAMTQRYAHLIYSSNYGTELEEARKQPKRAAVQSDTERTITEALLADPRTGSVKDFKFTWDGANLLVDFIVVPTIGGPARIGVIFK